MTHQLLQTGHIVGNHCQPVIKTVVNRHQRQVTVCQFLDPGICKVHTGNDHAVHTPVQAVLQITVVAAAYIIIDEGDVIAMGFRLCLDALQHGGEIFMGQTAAAFVHKQNTQIVGTFCFQGTGCRIGHVAHFPGCFFNSGTGLFTDIRLTVEGFADCGYRYPAAKRNVFHGNHKQSPSNYILNRFRNLNISYLVRNFKWFLENRKILSVFTVFHMWSAICFRTD